MIDVVLSGPGKNALSTSLMQGVIEQLARADGRPALVRGEGDAFSAGLNFVEIAQFDAEGLDNYLSTLEDMLYALYNYPGPTVALVNGHAIAGGCFVAMCCDYRVAAAESKLKIGLNEVALGMRFPQSALALARKRVAPQALDEVLLAARLYSPQEALRVGFIDEVATAAEAVARQRLAEMAKYPVDAYVAAKRAIRGGVLDADPATRASARRALLPYWTAPELKAHIAKFLLERRK